MDRWYNSLLTPTTQPPSDVLIARFPRTREVLYTIGHFVPHRCRVIPVQGGQGRLAPNWVVTTRLNVVGAH